MPIMARAWARKVRQQQIILLVWAQVQAQLAQIRQLRHLGKLSLGPLLVM